MRSSGLSIMLRLLGLVKPMAHIMVLCIIFGVGGFLAAIAITVLGAEMLLTIFKQSILGLSFQQIAIILVSCAILRGILRYVEQTCGHYIAFKLLAIIRDKLFTVLRKLAPAKLEGKGRGDLISLITGDIELLEVFYAHTIAPVVIAAIVSLIMSGLIAVLNPILGIYALAAYFIIGYIVPVALSRKGNATGLAIRNRLGELNSFFLESLRGMNESLQYGADEQRLTEIAAKTAELADLQAKIKQHEGISSGLSTFLISFLSLVMLILNIALQTELNITILSTVMLLASFGPVVALANLSTTLTGTLAAGERVLALLDEQPQTEDIFNGKQPIFNGAAVENISFAYKDEQILTDISLNFKQGNIIALSGKSGSGKSTLLKLLMRFWQVDSGIIKIGDEDINQISTEHLRKTESFMTQDTDLFQGTIYDNIAFVKPNASEAEIKAAAQKAAIDDFITSLPEGYQTQVAELGESLSGGERQRIGLARAFLHNADFLLLDEPTANLDSLNEGIILKSLQEAKGSKTVVLVSHRASAAGISDQHYALDSGRMS